MTLIPLVFLGRALTILSPCILPVLPFVFARVEQPFVRNGLPGGIVFHFYARDLHWVLGPASGGRPVRFKVSLDGAAPAADHGVDTDESGMGTVTDQRLYQPIRQSNDVREHEFSIQFLR